MEIETTGLHEAGIKITMIDDSMIDVNTCIRNALCKEMHQLLYTVLASYTVS